MTNYFRKNSELKEYNSIDNGDELKEIPSPKNEINININNINKNNISVSEKLKQQIYYYKNLLIHRDEHFCKKKKHISEEIMKQDENVEEFSKSIAFMKNATQNFLLKKTKEKEMNEKDITKLIDNIHKNINVGSEIELLDSNNKNENK